MMEGRSSDVLASPRRRGRVLTSLITVVLIVATVAVALFLYYGVRSFCGPGLEPQTIGILVNDTYTINDTVRITLVNFGAGTYEGKLEVQVFRQEGSSWVIDWTGTHQPVTALPGRVFDTAHYLASREGSFQILANLYNTEGDIINRSHWLSCGFSVITG